MLSRFMRPSSDSIGERSRLIQVAYPDLKEYCASRGYELHIMDMHWGLADWVTDDHTGPEKAMQILEKCTEGARTLSFVVSPRAQLMKSSACHI
jgi:hypothetical protein